MTSLHISQNRIYLTDNSGVVSFFFLTPKFQPVLVLRHFTNRSLMRSVVLDSVTVGVADKYGNLLVLRSLFDIQELVLSMDMLNDDNRTRSGHSVGLGRERDWKMSVVASLYVGSLITSLCMQRFSRSTDVLLYATITGEIGALMPLDSVTKVETLLTLESHMMSDASPVCRIVDDYRSYYLPSVVREHEETDE